MDKQIEAARALGWQETKRGAEGGPVQEHVFSRESDGQRIEVTLARTKNARDNYVNYKIQLRAHSLEAPKSVAVEQD